MSAPPDPPPAESEAQPANDAGTIEAEDGARRLFLGPCTFAAGAHKADQLPPQAAVEVAFAGRSNVGKSSLINALTGRRTLARTSQTPGRTQQINFFDLGGRLTLVDMPGYGYARASRTKARAWSALALLYLKGRACLRRVVLLIDARRGIGPSDTEIMTALDKAAVNYQIVLTKCDTLTATRVRAALEETTRMVGSRPAAHPEVIATSSRKGEGIDTLRLVLAALAAPEHFR